MAVTRSIAKDIGMRITSLPDNLESDSFQYRAILRDINKLKSVYISDYYMLMGILDAKLLRKDSAVANFNRAIANEPSQSIIHFNFGLVLKHLGCLTSAIGSFKKAIQLSYDPDAVVMILDICLLLGLFDVFEETCKLYIKAKPGDEQLITEDCERLSMLNANLAAVGISQSQYTFFMASVEEVLKSNDVRYRQFYPRINYFGESSYLYMEVLVDEPAGKIAAMNSEFIDEVVSQDHDIYDKLVVNFCHYSKDLIEGQVKGII
jgi:tetratricopeptide (TPR) repeat protein